MNCLAVDHAQENDRTNLTDAAGLDVLGSCVVESIAQKAA